MADVSCPQCGNPQLDVDAQDSVVYCKNCGFAVKIDPQTGQATPLSGGEAGGQMEAGAPPGYAPGPAPMGAGQGYSTGPKNILGTDPFTFLLGATIILLILTYYFSLGTTIFAVLEILLAVYYLMNR